MVGFTQSGRALQRLHRYATKHRLYEYDIKKSKSSSGLVNDFLKLGSTFMSLLSLNEYISTVKFVPISGSFKFLDLQELLHKQL